MSDNPNRTVLVVVVALAIILVLLLANAGSCSRSGGMGAGSAAPAASASTSASTAAPASPSSSSAAQTQQSAATATASASTASAAAASSASASASATSATIQEITVDDAIAAVQANAAQLGTSLRTAAATATAGDVYGALNARGFSSVELTTYYDANGTYIGPTSLDASSTDSYPTYVGLYESANAVQWAVYVNDGKFYASPLTANNAALSQEVLLTESDVVTEYDNGIFSDYTLQEIGAQGVKAVKVAAIDSTTLDSYTAAQIESM